MLSAASTSSSGLLQTQQSLDEESMIRDVAGASRLPGFGTYGVEEPGRLLDTSKLVRFLDNFSFHFLLGTVAKDELEIVHT